MEKLTITLKGVQDKNRPDFVKITMIFYKHPYNRVPKVLGITGLYKHWDQKTQRFKPKTKDAAINNGLLSSAVSKYHQVANIWDEQGQKWTPKDLSHHFDQPRELALKENIIPTVENYYKQWIELKRKNKKNKNGHEVDSEPYAKACERYMGFFARFVSEKYGKAFSSLQFSDITEEFLTSYVYFIEAEGAKKGNGGSLREKLNGIYQVVQRAERKGIPGANLDAFVVTNDKFKGAGDRTPSTISLNLLRAMESMDRSLITEEENMHLDFFLFCFYCGGMAPTDAAHLTWSCINMDRRKITYERMKTPKSARPPFVPRAEMIAKKYQSLCFGDFVLPMFDERHNTEHKRRNRMSYWCGLVNETLRRIVDILGYDEKITWYSARGTYITMMVDKGYKPEIVAEHSGNSVQTIFKFYWKNQQESDIIAELCLEFAA